MNALRRHCPTFFAWLRRLCVTPLEERMLAEAHSAAPHAALIRRADEIDQRVRNAEAVLASLERAEVCGRQIIDALRAPWRWMPETELTAEEGKAWESTLRSPLMIKIDAAMFNWAVQMAQNATAAPAGEIERQAGFARGCMAGWQMAKTLSRFAGTDAGNSETDPHTALAGLDHHQP